jgi:hypothetical protein
MGYWQAAKVADELGVKLKAHNKKCKPCKIGKPCGVFTRFYNQAKKAAEKAWRTNG